MQELRASWRRHLSMRMPNMQRPDDRAWLLDGAVPGRLEVDARSGRLMPNVRR